MIFSRIFAFTILFMCPLAWAQVKLNSTIDIKHSSQQKKQSISKEVKLAAHTSAVIYDQNDIHIVIELVDQRENEADVRYYICVKNRDGNNDVIAIPELVAVYDETATIELWEKSEQTDALTITLQAYKA